MKYTPTLILLLSVVVVPLLIACNHNTPTPTVMTVPTATATTAPTPTVTPVPPATATTAPTATPLPPVKDVTTNFEVTIENVFEGKEYFSNGKTGLIEPAKSESFSFNAGKGHYLSFATMFVQSNDLFFAPGESGIALYSDNGNALTGDLTDMILLWDAGTEVNEELGTGPNQAPRQSDANTGPLEDGNVHEPPEGPDFLQLVSQFAKFTLEHDGGTLFTLTIANVSDNNSSVTTPFAPGVWVVHYADQTPLFKEDMPASTGLERIAEDGLNSMLDSELSSKSGLVSPFAPGAYGINSEVFSVGSRASSALESLAEDGHPGGFTQVFNTPDGASAPGPIVPGGSYSFSFSAKDGDKLSLATMLVQSNDWFIGGNGIELFSNGVAISGDITNHMDLFDAGTEVDEYAGAGINQAPRQSGANTGGNENATVTKETDPSSNVPQVKDMVRITITVKE